VEENLLTTRPRRPWWRLPLLLAIVLAAIMLWRPHNPREVPGQQKANLPTPVPKNDPRPKVWLTVDFGNGDRTAFSPIAWQDGMTAADLTKAWMPVIPIKQKGEGESAFVTAIKDVENQGADGKNWTYTVNGQMADRSFEVYKLKPDDHVLWTFGPRK
jgi:hypothetical protein